MKKSVAEKMTKKPSSSTKKTEPDDVYDDADDDNYGLVRDPNFHSLEYCNRRRRCRFMDSCNGIDDDDCSYLDDPHVAVTCLRPILPSPFRELSYKSRTGWNYDPSSRNTPFLDRLGTGVADVKFFGEGYGRQQQKKRPRQQGNISEKTEKDDENRFALAVPFPMPSTKMIIPVSWTSIPSVGIGRENNGEGIRTASDGAKRKNVGNISNSAIEGNSKSNKRPKLSGDTATVVSKSTAGDTSRFSNDVRMSQDDKIKKSADSSVKSLPPPFSASIAATPSATAAAAAESGIVATTLVFPKEVLYKWYGKKPRKTKITPAQYMTWDTGRQNCQQFSAIFVCPMTNEAFLASPRTYDNKTHLTAAPDKYGLYWFPRKIIAEHAAAARAYDCLVMRASGGNNGSGGRLSGLEPYWPSQRPTWPVGGVPSRILERLSPEQYSGTTNTDPLNKKNDDDEVRTFPKTTLVKDDTDISSRTVDNDKEERKRQNYKQPKKSLIKQQAYSRVGGEKRNYGGGHRHARRQPPQNHINSSDHNNDRNSKLRDVENYRAQRMSYGQRDHYSQYQTNNQPRHEQQQMTESGFSYSPNIQQRETRRQGQFGSTTLQYGQNQLSQGIQHQIPERIHFDSQQHQQQNQYLEQQSNSNNFQYARNTHNQNNLQHSQQPIPIPPPPPPPPPPPLEPSHNYPTG